MSKVTETWKFTQSQTAFGRGCGWHLTSWQGHAAFFPLHVKWQMERPIAGAVVRPLLDGPLVRQSTRQWVQTSPFLPKWHFKTAAPVVKIQILPCYPFVRLNSLIGGLVGAELTLSLGLRYTRGSSDMLLAKASGGTAAKVLILYVLLTWQLLSQRCGVLKQPQGTVLHHHYPPGCSLGQWQSNGTADSFKDFKSAGSWKVFGRSEAPIAIL